LVPARTPSTDPTIRAPTNLTFCVTTPAGRWWVKVARNAADEDDLRRWAGVADCLATRHHAVPVVSQSHPGARLALRFTYLNAVCASRTDLAERIVELLAITRELHQDHELAARLGPPRSAGECFRSIWVRRLLADLEVLAGVIDTATVQWMHSQIMAIEKVSRRSEFNLAVQSPIHGDLWHENVMIDNGGTHRLWLLDWDDLAVGDPIADDAILLHDALGPDPDRWLSIRPLRDWREQRRMQAAAHAVLLDEVIDVLADAMVADRPDVAATKRAQHEEAMRQYRELYGSAQSS
jgi:Ser/Thr protein kinase RdoA (MazF antagonist)